MITNNFCIWCIALGLLLPPDLALLAVVKSLRSDAVRGHYSFSSLDHLVTRSSVLSSKMNQTAKYRAVTQRIDGKFFKTDKLTKEIQVTNQFSGRQMIFIRFCSMIWPFFEALTSFLSSMMRLCWKFFLML